jgi:hypothetical protein
VARWHQTINDPTYADAILDRLVHNAHRIERKADPCAGAHHPPLDQAIDLGDIDNHRSALQLRD